MILATTKQHWELSLILFLAALLVKIFETRMEKNSHLHFGRNLKCHFFMPWGFSIEVMGGLIKTSLRQLQRRNLLQSTLLSITALSLCNQFLWFPTEWLLTKYQRMVKWLIIKKITSLCYLKFEKRKCHFPVGWGRWFLCKVDCDPGSNLNYCALADKISHSNVK